MDSAHLTDREIGCLQAIADGCTSCTAGRALFVQPGTIDKHLASAMEKLGARTRTHAVAIAMRRQLIRATWWSVLLWGMSEAAPLQDMAAARCQAATCEALLAA